MYSHLSRSNSSPNLKARSPARRRLPSNGRASELRESQLNKFGYETEDDEFYVIGDRVYVDGYKPASVAYFGEVEFASGDWVGVVLDQPIGNHSGRVQGREYFQCAALHGLFVRTHRLSRIPDSALGSSAASSRAATPMPTSAQFQLGRRSSSRSPGASTLDSYYYDDDYRQDRRPTVESLARKLRSIDERGSSGYLSTDSPSKGGILKWTQRSSPQSSPRFDDLARRIRSSSQVSINDSDRSTFSFRPKRAQLSDLHNNSPELGKAQSQRGSYVDLSSEPAGKGDRVVVRTERGDTFGTLRFIGETNFATGEWAGVELDRADGRNDGSVLGVRYFYCADNYGLFVPATRVRKCRPGEDGRIFKSVRSTIKSPPPIKSSYSPASTTSRSSVGYGDSPSRLSTSPLNTNGSYSCSPSASLASSLYEPFSYSSRSNYNHKPIPLKSNSGLLNSRSSDHLNDMYGSRRQEKPKFDDRDIEFQLRKSLNQPIRSHVTSHNIEPVRPRSIKYTFTSSKYDGNPIARKTVEYD